MTTNDWIRRARGWYALTFVVATGAVVLQLILVIQGERPLAGDEAAAMPGLATRLVRFCSYLTIWTNVLGVVTAGALALDPFRDGRIWRVVRMNAVVLMTVVAVVHWFLLRPILDLHGANWLADKLLHIVVPLLVVTGWLMCGPRNRFQWHDLVGFLIIPVAWLVYTLVRGAVTGWYPYPFIDVELHGYLRVGLACLAISALTLLLAALSVWLDSRLPWAKP